MCRILLKQKKSKHKASARNDQGKSFTEDHKNKRNQNLEKETKNISCTLLN